MDTVRGKETKNLQLPVKPGGETREKNLRMKEREESQL